MINKNKQALVYSRRVSQRVAKDLPEIAEDYSHGISIPQIIENYEIMEKYEILRRDIAINIVRGALELLISKENLEDLATLHRQLSGSSSYVNGTRMFSLSEEEMQEARSRGGRTTSALHVKNNTGIFAPGVRDEAFKKGVAARGFTLWRDEEREYARTLKEQGKTSSQIAYLANLRFHDGRNVRKANAISSALRARR